MAKAFETWTFKGLRFLAVPDNTESPRNYHIMDERGGNYGSFMTVERFRKLQREGHDFATPFADSKARANVRVL